MALECRAWQAWLNTMPPKPDDFHVTGDVLVSNPGVVPMLSMREPQGINPAILMLDLHLYQQPGNWVQVVTCNPARFDRVMPPNSVRYESVEIYSDGDRIATIDQISVVA